MMKRDGDMRKRTLILVLILMVLSGVFCAGLSERKKECEHEWVLENTVPATCTETGTEKYRCSLCGKTKSESIPALGHEWGACTVLQNPTCTEDGVTRCYCIRDASHYEDKTLPALGHKWGSWATQKKPTFTVSGYKSHVCERCGNTGRQKIPALLQQDSYALALMFLLVTPFTLR